jgi:hypothetical protein
MKRVCAILCNASSHSWDKNCLNKPGLGLDRVVRAVRCVPKVAGFSPSSGSESPFHIGLLLTVRGCSMWAPMVACLLCYLSNNLCSQVPRAALWGWVGVIQNPKCTYLVGVIQNPKCTYLVGIIQNPKCTYLVGVIQNPKFIYLFISFFS